MTIDYHQRYCLECKQFFLDLGSGAESDVTPGGDFASMGCFLHWFLDYDDYSEQYKKMICMARTCPDFEPDPELAKIGRELAKTENKGESK